MPPPVRLQGIFLKPPYFTCEKWDCRHIMRASVPLPQPRPRSRRPRRSCSLLLHLRAGDKRTRTTTTTSRLTNFSQEFRSSRSCESDQVVDFFEPSQLRTRGAWARDRAETERAERGDERPPVEILVDGSGLCIGFVPYSFAFSLSSSFNQTLLLSNLILLERKDSCLTRR